MLTYIKEKSTIQKQWSRLSVNQPIIMTYTDSNNPKYIEVELDNNTFRAYALNGYYTFDFTNYVRNQFENITSTYEATDEKSGSKMTYVDDKNIWTIIKLPKNDDMETLEYTNYVFGNKLAVIGDSLNNGLSSKIFTDWTKIIKYEGMPLTVSFWDTGERRFSVNSGSFRQFVSNKRGVASPLLGNLNGEIALGEAVYNESSAASYAYFYKVPFKPLDGHTYRLKINGSWISGDEHFNSFSIAVAGDVTPQLDIYWDSISSTSVTVSGNKNLYIGFTSASYAEQCKTGGSFPEYSADVKASIFSYEIFDGNEKVFEEKPITAVPVITRPIPHNGLYVRWINKYGGWDYYMFDRRIIDTTNLEEVNTINVGIKTQLGNSEFVYNKKFTRTLTAKSRTENEIDFKELGFMPFSSKIQRYVDGKWQDVIIEDFEKSYWVCQNAGSWEFTFKIPNDYGLSFSY